MMKIIDIFRKEYVLLKIRRKKDEKMLNIYHQSYKNFPYILQLSLLNIDEFYSQLMFLFYSELYLYQNSKFVVGSALAQCVCRLYLSMWVGVARVIYMFGYPRYIPTVF